MPSSLAQVATDQAARYAKKLASHLGRKIPVETLPGTIRLDFPLGHGFLVPQPGQLLLSATAEDPHALERVQDVLGRHLERFGRRNELTVTWQSQ
ncbi:DUF2218 domain-containing protein [Streptomyces sp. IBSNAI002]|uniref:DUF2218 domain-containing protein n=1 Tax=Streptomyces sp. IBSNAI002 TaxID=3457500 RepID=UPI003FD3C657